MLSITAQTLTKITAVLISLGYAIRYGRGNFKTGICLLQRSKVIVVNKFADLETKINALSILLQEMPVEEHLLDHKQKHLINTIKQTKIKF